MTGTGIRDPGTSELEEIVEGLFRAARLLGIVVLAWGRGGLALPGCSSREVLALVGDVLRRHASGEPDRALEGRAGIEVHALHARAQVDLALRALAARHDLGIDDGAAARAPPDLALAHHPGIAGAFG